jgi:hypothetical protein
MIRVLNDKSYVQPDVLCFPVSICKHSLKITKSVAVVKITSRFVYVLVCILLVVFGQSC